jgi:hypothetical protein
VYGAVYIGTLQDNCTGRACTREAVYGAARSEDYKIKVDRGSIGGACKYAKLCTAPLHRDTTR